MRARDAREFEITFKAKGKARRRMRSDVVVTLVKPDATHEVFHLATDEGSQLGGENTAPPPLAYLASALVGCLLTHLRLFSESLEIPIRNADVSAEFCWRGRSIDGMPYESTVGEISVLIKIDSDATEGELLRLIAATKQGSFIEHVLSQSVKVSHRLKRPGGWISL